MAKLPVMAFDDGGERSFELLKEASRYIRKRIGGNTPHLRKQLDGRRRRNLLVFFSLLFNIADFLGNCLQCVLEVGVLRLKI
jgi:hypothetical protein